MFSVGYGFKKRETRIRELLDEEPSTSVILAAVHFEWSIKRSILMLGHSPTAELRKKLEDTWALSSNETDKAGRLTIKGLWKSEISEQIRNAAIGKVVANFPKCIEKAKSARGKVIHGNGTVSKATASEAVDEYLSAACKIYEFSHRHGVELDSRLKPRRKRRRG